MFTTEIWEGFDVQMTQDMNETVEKYGELTHAIMNRYLLEFGKLNTPPNAVCPTFGEFVEHCKDLDLKLVSNVFGVQLMQVSYVIWYAVDQWLLLPWGKVRVEVRVEA